jgi:hypothetical protein
MGSAADLGSNAVQSIVDATDPAIAVRYLSLTAGIRYALGGDLPSVMRYTMTESRQVAYQLGM